MKKLAGIGAIVLGLIFAFPILFQSVHAFKHHILAHHHEVSCCSIHHHETETTENHQQAIDETLELCPICEYQIVSFPTPQPVQVVAKFQFIDTRNYFHYSQPFAHDVSQITSLRGPPQSC
mgnify:CR=1 FL=1